MTYFVRALPASSSLALSVICNRSVILVPLVGRLCFMGLYADVLPVALMWSESSNLDRLVNSFQKIIIKKKLAQKSNFIDSLKL